MPLNVPVLGVQRHHANIGVVEVDSLAVTGRCRRGQAVGLVHLGRIAHVPLLAPFEAATGRIEGVQRHVTGIAQGRNEYAATGDDRAANSVADRCRPEYVLRRRELGRHCHLGSGDPVAVRTSELRPVLCLDRGNRQDTRCQHRGHRSQHDLVLRISLKLGCGSTGFDAGHPIRGRVTVPLRRAIRR